MQQQLRHQRLNRDLTLEDVFRYAVLTTIRESTGPIKVSDLAKSMEVRPEELYHPLRVLKHESYEDHRIGYQGVPNKDTYIFRRPLLVMYSD